VVSVRKQTAAEKSNVLISRARPDSSGNKPTKELNPLGWGRFRCQDNTSPDGITVATFNNKVSRWTYFVKTAPKEGTDTTPYVAASKMQRLVATSQLKPPKLKVKKDGTVKTKKDMLYDFEPSAFDLVGNPTTLRPVKNGDANKTTIKLQRGVYQFWSAGGKKAPSARTTISFDG
jgi:hypothetical protein